MLSINTSRRTAQVVVAATALTVLGAGVALACNTQPAKPVVHKIQHNQPCPPKPVVKPSPKPSCSPKPTVTPTPSPTPVPTATPSPTPAPTGQGQVLSTSTQPATLPDTGASLGGSTLGLGAMISAGVAYIKTRKR